MYACFTATHNAHCRLVNKKLPLGTVFGCVVHSIFLLLKFCGRSSNPQFHFGFSNIMYNHDGGFNIATV